MVYPHILKNVQNVTLLVLERIQKQDRGLEPSPQENHKWLKPGAEDLVGIPHREAI